jgi:hypothetical protein
MKTRRRQTPKAAFWPVFRTWDTEPHPDRKYFAILRTVHRNYRRCIRKAACLTSKLVNEEPTRLNNRSQLKRKWWQKKTCTADSLQFPATSLLSYLINSFFITGAGQGVVGSSSDFRLSSPIFVKDFNKYYGEYRISTYTQRI